MSIDKQNHILLAEDNEFNQELIVDLLSDAGFSVSTANNGQEVLNLLAQNASDFFQLILMDLEMPVMDGHQATLKIREDSQYQSIPILALTADEEADTKNRCLAEGMQDYLIKPFDPDKLNETIYHWLNQGQQPQHATSKTETENAVLPDFKYINTTTGLHSTAHNQTLYLQLLRRFANTQNTSLEAIKHALTNGIADENFRRLIHTLKGVSATIGASAIAALCIQIEISQAKHDDKIHTESAQLLLQLSEELNKCIQELVVFFQHSAADRIEPLSIERDKPQSNETGEIKSSFLELLHDSNPEALNYFEKHQPYFVTIFNNDDHQALQNAIENYDFDQAIELINKI